MLTLGRWVNRLLPVPLAIECPMMRILGREHEPPLFTGSGRISVPSRTTLEFIMHAHPRSDVSVLARYKRAKDNPDSIHDQFRLEATDYEGNEWVGGWTDIQIGEVCAGVWRLSGLLNLLTTGVSGHWVQSESSVELVYDTELRLPMRTNMATTVIRDGKEVLRSWEPGSQIVEVAGTSIEFFHAAEGRAIWATAKTSSQFRHPHAENWISEPLRFLLGQLVFPRLVARNKGDGTAEVWLRRTPQRMADPLVASILGEDPLGAYDRFWVLYRDLLAMIVDATDENGHANFEAHPLTAYYHEIADASVASNWVLCMTLASVAEGITEMVAPTADRPSSHPSETIEDLRQRLLQWHGDEGLRSRALGFLSNVERARDGTHRVLSRMCTEGLLDDEQVAVWKSVRNRVMHGEMIAPWVDTELRQKIQILASLVHRLALVYVRKCAETRAC